MLQDEQIASPDDRPEYSITLTQSDGSLKVFYAPTEMGLKFHQSDAKYLLLCGGRGTGKSTIGRNDIHARAMAHPGYRALIVRNTYPALRRSHLVDIVPEMNALGGTFNKTENVANYPNDSKCWYGACDDEATIASYLSAQFHHLFLDELVTIPLDRFLNLSACVRVPKGSGFKAVVRAATNTLGPHARYVKRWFIDKTVTLEEAESYNPNDFETIHSTLADNPHLDAEEYIETLGNLGASQRRSWIHNEWVLEGSYFSDFLPRDAEGKSFHIIGALPLVNGKPLLEQQWISIYRALDWGFYPDPAVCLWIAVLPNGRAIVFKEKSWLRTTAADVAKDIVKESKGMRIVDTYHDPSMRATSGHEGVSIADYFERNGVPLTPSRNDRAASGMAIHEYLNTIIDTEPKLQIVGEACPNLVQTIPEMQVDKRDPSKIAAGNDHYVISLGYFCQGDISPSHEPLAKAAPWMIRKTPARSRLGSESARRRHAT